MDQDRLDDLVSAFVWGFKEYLEGRLAPDELNLRLGEIRAAKLARLLDLPSEIVGAPTLGGELYKKV